MSIFNVEITFDTIRNLVSRKRDEAAYNESRRREEEARKIKEEMRKGEEMDTNQFWISFWKLIFVTTLLIIATIGGCCSYSNYLDSKETEFYLKNGYKRAQIPTQFKDGWIKDEAK